jgi:hypothetical protein
MHRARHQFLARAALAQYQHRISALAHSFDQAVHALHLHRDTDQIREPRPRPQRLTQHAVFLIHVQQANHAVQLAAQLRDVKRLGNVIRRPRRVASTALSIVPYCVSTSTAVCG